MNGGNEPEFAARLGNSADIHYLHKDVLDEFADVQLISDTGHCFYVNRLIMASHSQLLFQMLKSSLEEDVMAISTNLNNDQLLYLTAFMTTGIILPSSTAADKDTFRALGIPEIPSLTKLEESLPKQEPIFGRPEDWPLKKRKKKKLLKVSKKVKRQQLVEEFKNYFVLNSSDTSSSKCFSLPMPIESYLNEPSNQIKSKEGHYQCKDCSSCFLSSKRLLLHRGEKHHVRLTCPTCNEAFKPTRRHSFKRHMFFHEDTSSTAVITKGHECIQCGYSGSHTSNIRNHIRFQGKYHDNTCTHCEMTFGTHAEYRNHVENQHGNVWLLRCGHCQQVFDTSLKWSRHRRSVHFNLPTARTSDDEKKLSRVCEQCGTVFKNQYNLNNHLKRGHGEKKIACGQCDKKFANEFAMERHVKEWHDTSPCSVCGKLLASKTRKRHMLSKHDVDKRKHKCTLCNKSFVEAQGLKDHMNVHTGDRPYECKYCGKNYASCANKRMHERVGHEGHKRAAK